MQKMMANAQEEFRSGEGSSILNFRVALLFLIFWLSVTARAEQGCAPGFYPGGVQPNGPICIPIPGYGTTNNTNPLSSSKPTTRWALTWGAFASDATEAVVGTSTGQFSQRAARREAMKKCSSMGGGNCKVTLAYENQCAVIADPIEEDFYPRYGSEAGGSTVEVASELALKRCSEKNSGRSCEVIYSNCTAPVLVHD